MDYLIRPASPLDVPDLMALRTEAETWLRSRGTDQWSDPETGGRAIAKWRDAIAQGLSWVVTSRDVVVGTISRGPADLDFWTVNDEPETAIYLYKLIVSRSAAGNGLGSLMLDWACQAAAAEGRRWVRIDCWRTNRQLQRYYEKLAFSHVRTEAPKHRRSGWLAQRPADTILEPERSLSLARA